MTRRPADVRADHHQHAARRLSQLAQEINPEWPVVTYRMEREPRVISHGHGPNPPGMRLDTDSARAELFGAAALTACAAAARQNALPYFTHADARAEDRRERQSFTVATALGPMTDWAQHRGQSYQARYGGAYRRARHFSDAWTRAWRADQHVRAAYLAARDANEAQWEEELARAA